jgi:hypothetical protein
MLTLSFSHPDPERMTRPAVLAVPPGRLSTQAGFAPEAPVIAAKYNCHRETLNQVQGLAEAGSE